MKEQTETAKDAGDAKNDGRIATTRRRSERTDEQRAAEKAARAAAKVDALDRQAGRSEERRVPKFSIHFRYTNQPHGYCLSRKEWIALWKEDERDLGHSRKIRRADLESLFDVHLLHRDYAIIEHQDGICRTLARMEKNGRGEGKGGTT